jgi:predicted nucleic acid-binding protein
MYTVDASVWVNAFDQREPGHQVSRQFLDLLRAQALPVIVPNLVLVEVSGAISRTRRAPEQAQAFAFALGRLPHVTIRALDEILTIQALAVAAQHGLRGADAVYAAVATRGREYAGHLRQ